MLKATVDGLKSLRRPEEVAKIRGLTISQVLPVSKTQVSDTEVSDTPAAAPVEAVSDTEVSDTKETPES
jgi:hypothetical protein